MDINLEQLERHAKALELAKADLAKAKRDIEHQRLQLKEIRLQVKRTKSDELIKAFVAAMPKDCVEIVPAPGLTYVSVTLSVIAASLYRDVPETLGLKLFKDEEVDKNKLHGPRCRVYRSPHSCAHFYITSHSH